MTACSRWQAKGTDGSATSFGAKSGDGRVSQRDYALCAAQIWHRGHHSNPSRSV
jgi:hypothetical protein